MARLAVAFLLCLLAGCGAQQALTAPSAALSVTAVSFPSTTIGTEGPNNTVTLSNPGGQPLWLSSYVLSDTLNFAVTTNCTISLAPGASCTFTVAFHPQTVAPLSATLTLTDNSGSDSGTQQLIALSGTGTPVPVPQAELAPSSLSFPQTILHISTAPQVITLTNPGTEPLELTGAVLSDTSDFTLTSTCGSTLAPNTSCTFAIVFQPQTVGPVNATLALTDNSGGESGAQQTASLAAAGLPIPLAQAMLTPTSLSFADTIVGTSTAAQPINLSNTGTAPLAISGLRLADSADYSLSSTCGASLAPGASCSLAVLFHPQTTGALPSTLTLTDNSAITAGTVQQVIALTGAGLPVPVPQATVASGAASFGSINVGSASTAQTFSLTNTGTATLTLSSIALSDPTDYTLTNTCGTSLPAGTACSLTVVFQPQKAGALAASIVISDNSQGTAGALQTIALTGTGVPLPSPQAVLTPSSLSFADTMITTTSAAQAILLSNTGNAPLTITGLVLSDTQNFVLTSTCSATLAANASCTLSIAFQPQSIAADHATVTLTDNSGGSIAAAQQTLTIAGNGIAFTEPRAVVAPSNLTFPQTVTNASSAPETVTLTNTGTTPLTISGVTLSGTAAAAFTLGQGTCAGQLAAGAACTETVTYTPTLASASDSANLVFTDNALGQAGSTQTATLTASAIGEVDSVTNFGDSITCGFYAQPNDGTGLVYSLEGYAGLFDTFLGVPALNSCRQGDTAADMSRLWVPFKSSPASNGNQLYTVMIGTNDSYRYGIPQIALQTYSQEVGAALSWLSIPNSDKVLADTVAQQTGNWTADVAFGLMSTDAGASLTFNVNQAVAGRNLYLVFHVWALPYGQAGKASIAIDGITQVTVDESQNSGVFIPTENGTSDTFLVQTVPLGAVGPHTVTFSSAGPAGSQVGLLWAGTPQYDYHLVDGAPRVLVGLVPNSPSGNQTFAADNYSLQLTSLVPALAADGMNLTIVPTNRVMDPNTDFADILHPNNSGHGKLAAAFEKYR